MLIAEYTRIDVYLYNILCMFDFPGFMVRMLPVMQLAPALDLWLEHYSWFSLDPGDNNLGLIHATSYNLHYQDTFLLNYFSLPPACLVYS